MRRVECARYGVPRIAGMKHGVGFGLDTQFRHRTIVQADLHQRLREAEGFEHFFVGERPIPDREMVDKPLKAFAGIGCRWAGVAVLKRLRADYRA